MQCLKSEGGIFSSEVTEVPKLWPLLGQVDLGVLSNSIFELECGSAEGLQGRTDVSLAYYSGVWRKSMVEMGDGAAKDYSRTEVAGGKRYGKRSVPEVLPVTSVSKYLQDLPFHHR